MSGDVEELEGTEKNTLKVFKSITLVHEVGMVLLEVSLTVNLGIYPLLFVISYYCIKSVNNSGCIILFFSG